MTKHYLLLFLIYTFVFYGKSQTNPELTPFTNYGSCYQGLKSAEGKMLWPADFESLVKIWDYNYDHIPRTYCWVAEKNGSFGLIDHEGKLVLPFSYSHIASFPDGFIAADEKAAYLLTPQFEITWELPGYSWIRPTSTGYIVEKGELFGFLDLHHNEILPTKYNRIDFSTIQYESEGVRAYLSDRFLEVKLDQMKGVFDLNQNKWVIPFTAKFIQVEWVTLCSKSDAVFYLRDSESTFIDVFNSSGAKTLSNTDKNTLHFHFTPIDSCGTESYQMAYLSEDQKMWIVNLKTGQISKKYTQLFPLDGRSVHFEDSKWGVLDTNFAQLERFNYPKNIKAELQYKPETPVRSVAEWRFETLFSEYHTKNRDSILILREFYSQRSKERNNTGLDEFYGLVNFHTGKQVKPDYHWIVEMQFEGDSYYWAVNYNFIEEGMQDINNVDVYNSDLKLLKRFKNSPSMDFMQNGKHDQNFILYSDGLGGMLNPRGDIIIPIAYSEIYQKEVRSKGHPANKTTIIIARHDLQATVFDLNGNVLISKSYGNFKVDGALIHALREDHLTDVYNSEGELLIEGARYFKGASRTDGFGTCIGMEDWQRILPGYAIYITKGDSLYEFLNDTLKLLDQHFFEFTQNYCYFHEWALIDQKGKIITMTPKGIPSISTRDRQLSPYKCSTLLDEYPVPVKESKPVTTTNYVPSPKRFIWKQHDVKNPNEWFVYTGNGVLLYTEPFEYPLAESVMTGGVFKQNGKYGYFDGNYNKLLDAEYDYIYPNHFLTLKDGLWQIHNLLEGKVSEGFEQISMVKTNKLRFVFHEGKIGLLNDSLQLEIPLTDSIEFLAKYDLVKLSNLSSNSRTQTTHLYRDIVHFGVPKEIYRNINNFHILEEAYLYSTANELLDFSPVDRYRNDLPYGLRYLVIFHHPSALRRVRRPTFFNSHFYSEMTLDRHQRTTHSDWDEHTKQDLYKFKKQYNYKISGTQLTPIELEDVLKTDAQSVIKLNELMIRELNKIQAFGENCTDIEDKLVQLKLKFLLDRQKIVFYWQEIGGFQIQLSFSELQELFLYPNKMK